MYSFLCKKIKSIGAIVFEVRTGGHSQTNRQTTTQFGLHSRSEGKDIFCYGLACFLPVSTLPEARRQQTSGDAAETQEIQEQNDPWLQDTGYWADQHGTGTIYC